MKPGMVCLRGDEEAAGAGVDAGSDLIEDEGSSSPVLE